MVMYKVKMAIDSIQEKNNVSATSTLNSLINDYCLKNFAISVADKTQRKVLKEIFGKVNTILERFDAVQATMITKESKIENPENMLYKIEECVEDKIAELIRKAQDPKKQEKELNSLIGGLETTSKFSKMVTDVIPTDDSKQN